MMVGWVDPVEMGAQHRHRNTIGCQAAAVCCRINPIGKTAEHRPSSQSKGTTQAIRHLQGMGRSGARPDHRDGLTSLQATQQGAIPAMKQTCWRGCQCIQGIWPIAVPLQQHVIRDMDNRIGSPVRSVLIELVPKAERPTQVPLQAIARPGPQDLQADVIGDCDSVQSSNASRTDAGTATPQPTPMTRQTLQYICTDPIMSSGGCAAHPQQT